MSSRSVDDLALPYEDLWYIKLINETDKNPLETWGGYSQDFEAAENVYSHKEVLESDHENWGIVGIKGDDRYLLIFDLDVHKAPDDFDPDSVTAPTDTAVVRSQSGGVHVPFVVVAPDGEGKESDFEMTYDLEWDIDIRGSYVKHHVVAPAAIPGVGGLYELTNDETLLTVHNPGDAAERIRYLGDPESEKNHGESLLKHAPAGGFGGTVAIDRDVEPPEKMPTCYHRGLQVRAANPDDPNVNTHKVNTLTALCGLAAGYSIETMVTHFCEDFVPGANADERETRYQLETMAAKMDRDSLAPPAITTLRSCGILEDSETCSCSIDYHGKAPVDRRLTEGGTVEGDGDRDVTDAGVVPPQNFSIKDGGYGKHVEKSNENGEPILVWNEWTNFELELNSIITTPEGDKEMSLTVHPRSEDEYDVEVEPTVLNETRSFKKEVCTGATTTFDGNGSDLAKIKQYVGSQEAPHKVGTHHMGYHRDGDRAVWVTPNGNLGADGWIDETETVLVEKGITAERKWKLSPDDGDDPDFEAVTEMMELLIEARNPSRMLPLLGWFYAAATRPLILNWEGQFNFAAVTGGSGSGKTTTLETLWELFGMESEPLSPDTTEASLMTTFASSNSVPMWFDEYKPSDMDYKRVNKFNEFLRKATKGQLNQRSNKDLSDTTYRLHAPTVVSGEERIQGSAEERRGIFTSFQQATTRPGSDTAIANAKLNGTSTEDPDDPKKSVDFPGYDFNDHAIAYIMWVCDQDPDDLRELWRTADEYVRDVVIGAGISGLGDLELQGLQTIRYGCLLFNQFYEACGGTGELVTDDDVRDAINFVIAGAAGGDNRKDHLDVMLEVATRAAADGYLEEDEHYTFVRKGTESEELRIVLAHAFDKVKKYARDHDVSDDLLNNKSDYDERLRNDSDNIPWFTCRGQRSPPIGDALGISTAIAEEEIDGFGRWMWDSEVEGSSEDEWKPLNTTAEGRISVTFEVTHRETDTPDAIAESGVIADESKAMDYVIFQSDRAKVPQLEEGKCYAAKGVKIGTHDGSPQIVFDGGVRDLREVEQGFGYIESADAGMNAEIPTSAATDGGEIDQLTGKVYEAVSEHGPIPKARLSGLLVGQNPAYDFEDVAGAIESLTTKGKIHDFGDGLETTN